MRMIGKIAGTGSYVPSNYYDNDDLAKLVDTNDEWIRERTGIIKRHIAKGDETTVSMACRAARAAMTNAGIDAGEIDLIIVSTISSNVVLPCTACEVQREIGAGQAVCFDLNAACTGFLFAYNTAQAYIQSGWCRAALVIGAERLSELVDWSDRGTCILFGDGAGAAVLKAEPGEAFPMVSHSDGARGDALVCESRCAKPEKTADGCIRMDGQGVFKFAVRQVPECICELLEKADLNIEEIDYFILHQANKRIVEAVARRLQTDIGKFPMNLMEYGNTSSASIPILLDELNRKGMLRRGQKLVLSGFGAGLSWGASLLEW